MYVSTLLCGHLADFEVCDIRQSTEYTSASLSLLEVIGINLVPLSLSGSLMSALQIPEIFLNHFSYIKICTYCIINIWSVNTILYSLCPMFLRRSWWWADLIFSVHFIGQNMRSQNFCRLCIVAPLSLWELWFEQT